MWKSGKTGVVYSGAQLTFHSLHLHKNFLPKMGKININNLMQLVFLLQADNGQFQFWMMMLLSEKKNRTMAAFYPAAASLFVDGSRTAQARK